MLLFYFHHLKWNHWTGSLSSLSVSGLEESLNSTPSVASLSFVSVCFFTNSAIQAATTFVIACVTKLLDIGIVSLSIFTSQDSPNFSASKFSFASLLSLALPWSDSSSSSRTISGGISAVLKAKQLLIDKKNFQLNSKSPEFQMISD